MKRFLAVLIAAPLLLSGCDAENSASPLEPEVPDPSMATSTANEFSPPVDCTNCLVPPTPIVREKGDPPRTVVRFDGNPGEEAELVIHASNPGQSLVLAWFNRKLVLRPFELARSGSEEIRIPLELKEDNLLWVQLIGRKGDVVTFWVEGGEVPDAQLPLWTDVGVVPTGSPAAPVVVADNQGLATLLLTDPESGAPQGAASVLPGVTGMGLVRFNEAGVPVASFFGGGVAYLRDWSVDGGVPSVSVFIPAGGALSEATVSLALPDAFLPVVDRFLNTPPTSSPGAAFGVAQLQTLSLSEALAAQAAWCAVEVAGAIPGSANACRTTLIEGVPTFWNQWTEEIGFEPFLPTVTGSLNLGGCTGMDCLTQAVLLASTTVDDATPRKLAVVSGDAQVGFPGVALTDPVLVRITNQWDVPLPGFLVDFTIETGGGFLGVGNTEWSGATDSNGSVGATWTLGSTLGGQTLSVGTISFTSLRGEATATAEAQAPSLVFQVTSGTVPVTADKNAECSSTFGSGFGIADWKAVADAVAAGFEKSAILDAGTAFITNNESATTGGMFSAHYIISATGAVGTTLGTIGTDLFWLSSTNSDQRVLCMGPSN